MIAKFILFTVILFSMPLTATGQSSFVSAVRGESSTVFAQEYGDVQNIELRSPFATNPIYVRTNSTVFREGFEDYGTTQRSTCYSGAYSSTDIAYTGNFTAVSMAGSRAQSTLFTHALSHTNITSWWIAESSSFSMVPVNIDVVLNGWLFTAGGLGTESAINIRVLEKTLLNTQLLYASGVAVENSYLATDFSSLVPGNWDAWADSWSETSNSITSRAGADTMWDLNYSQHINNMLFVPTHTPFCIEYSVHPSTYINSNSGQKWATSSFTGWTNVQLTTDQFDSNVHEMNVVPEPGVFMVMFYGLVFFAKYRMR